MRDDTPEVALLSRFAGKRQREHGRGGGGTNVEAAAQALGDWMSLDKRGRRGVRVHLKGAVEPALRALIAAVDDALAARV